MMGRLAVEAGVNTTVSKQNCLFSRKPQYLLLSFSTDWMRSVHIVEGHLLDSMSSDRIVNLVIKPLDSNT
jgi:hypothetical protein